MPQVREEAKDCKGSVFCLAKALEIHNDYAAERKWKVLLLQWVRM